MQPLDQIVQLKTMMLGQIYGHPTNLMERWVDGKWVPVEGYDEIVLFGEQWLIDWACRSWNQLWQWEWVSFGEFTT